MKNFSIRIFAISTWVMLAAITNATAMEYAVIINSENNLSGDEENLKKQVQRVFLKQQTSWGSIDAYPIGRRETDEVYAHFLSDVLKMNEIEFQAYWLSFKQREGQTPPRKIGTVSRIIKMVERKPGGISFVDMSKVDSLPDTVKVLFHF
ncbi:hypothetical protein [Pseudemcibacter aquimaris]|uniref:hypothetical protein n=1 Tax=Pseudemcibacter aquimaris TaxID=2857064 RepID=UPI0020134299|nr:hypothetical protein [Pseudemcibacter aquimaris]MCC3860073.1 hypothetical protein [Pseudemcibacter aquimaris]WDU57402.1 hypothetical protein KW060_09345 [Pseudemcibacter aquimaris]